MLYKSKTFELLELLYIVRDENIRYIRRYISDISDIGDVRHDIGDHRYIADKSVLDRYIVDILVLDRYIVEILGLLHTRSLD